MIQIPPFIEKNAQIRLQEKIIKKNAKFQKKI